MSFLNPLFLLALGALAVPVFLHLIRRRDGRTVDFPAVRYLRRTTREHARIIRLRQLLLLALRMVAVILIVLAGARIILPLGGRDHPSAGLVMVVDNGLTASAILGQGRVLDSLVARGEEALERTGAQDRVWVVAAGEPWAPAIPMTPEEARRALARLEPTHVTPDLSAQLRRADALLGASGLEIRETILLSDLRPAALPESDAGAVQREGTVHIVAPPPAPSANRGIAEIQVSGGLTPLAGDPAELHVRISGAAVADVLLRTYLDERLVASARTDARGSATFSLPLLPEGWIHGRVELEPDDLRLDDVAFFAFRALPPPRVYAGPEHASFLSDALDALDDGGRLRRVAPQEADVHIVTTGLAADPLPGSVIVLVPPEDPALLPAANLLLEELVPGWRLDPGDGDTGTERRVEGGAASTLLPEQPAVRLAHGIEIAAGAPAGRVLLALSDGSPWLVEATADDLTVLVLASPLVPVASDLPLSAAMVPVVDLLTLPRGATGNPTGVPAGAPLPVPPGAAAVRAPDGTLHALDGMPSFSRTGQTGIHRFVTGDGQATNLAAVNPRPADEPPLTAEEAARRLAAEWENARAAPAWPNPVLEGRSGREAWRWLMAVLLGVLLVEAWMAASATAAPGAPGSTGKVPKSRERQTGTLRPETRNP